MNKPRPAGSAYATDRYGWAIYQAGLLRQGRLAAARETDFRLSAFPEPLSYTWHDITERDFPWDR